MNLDKFKPARGYILVQLVEQANQTAKGLFLPENVKDKPTEGIVVAVGEPLFNDNGHEIKLQVSKGDNVSFGKWSGSQLTFSDKPDQSFIIMKDSDILGIFKN